MSSKTTLNDTLAERGATHGDYATQASVSQDLKNIMAATPNWHELPPYYRESLEMVALKVSRILTGDFMHPDNPLDISGYCMLVYRQLTEGGPSK